MGTVVETPKPKQQLTLKQHLASPDFAAQVAAALPSHMKPERMIRVALTALTRTPKLAECTQASFFKCLLDLSAWGLEPDGRRAHLIPFEDRRKQITECTLIIDYKGLAELCYRSGKVKAIHADVVRRGDLFDFSCGYITKHTPWFLRDPKDRPEEAGEVFAAYAVVQMVGDTAKHEVMSFDEVEAIKERSSGWKAYKAGYTKTCPWLSDWNEMAKKTVFRRCSKWLPLSAEMMDAADRDISYEDNDASARDHRLIDAPRTLSDLIAKDMQAAATKQTETNIDADAPQSELTLAQEFAACTTLKEATALRDRISGPDGIGNEQEAAQAEELFAQWVKLNK